MKAILISVKSQYVNHIIDGSKKYEYRKILGKKKCDTLLIYSCSPVKKIVASAKIETTISDSPISLWERTKEYSGICYDDYMKYFYNKEKAHAYKLSNVHIFDTPHELKDYGIKTAPQSFMYVNF